MSAKAHAIITKPTFTLADRLKIQQERNRNREYLAIGRLTSVVFEAQRDTSGLSDSKARYHSGAQRRALANQPGMHPFSEKQTVLWSSITLDWLGYKNAPLIALSRDKHDLLLPNGMPPLPDIPDPRWVAQHSLDACPKNTKTGCSKCVAPRIPQLLTGCPIVGDRVRDKIVARDGRTLGVIHPIVELCVMLHGVSGAFGKIRGGVDQADGTHLALVIDDSDPNRLLGYFVGGQFQFGG